MKRSKTGQWEKSNRFTVCQFASVCLTLETKFISHRLSCFGSRAMWACKFCSIGTVTTFINDMSITYFHHRWSYGLHYRSMGPWITWAISVLLTCHLWTSHRLRLHVLVKFSYQCTSAWINGVVVSTVSHILTHHYLGDSVLPRTGSIKHSVQIAQYLAWCLPRCIDHTTIT